MDFYIETQKEEIEFAKSKQQEKLSMKMKKLENSDQASSSCSVSSATVSPGVRAG